MKMYKDFTDLIVAFYGLTLQVLEDSDYCKLIRGIWWSCAKIKWERPT